MVIKSHLPEDNGDGHPLRLIAIFIEEVHAAIAALPEKQWRTYARALLYVLMIEPELLSEQFTRGEEGRAFCRTCDRRATCAEICHRLAAFLGAEQPGRRRTYLPEILAQLQPRCRPRVQEAWEGAAALLKPREYEAIELVYFCGLRPSEAAERVGVTPHTIRRRLRAAEKTRDRWVRDMRSGD